MTSASWVKDVGAAVGTYRSHLSWGGSVIDKMAEGARRMLTFQLGQVGTPGHSFLEFD